MPRKKMDVTCDVTKVMTVDKEREKNNMFNEVLAMAMESYSQALKFGVQVGEVALKDFARKAAVIYLEAKKLVDEHFDA